jgi:hypothetical protein
VAVWQTEQESFPMVTVSTFNRRRRPAFEASRNGASRSAVNRKRLAVQLLAILALLALLVTGGLWAAGVFSDPAEVRALRQAVDEQVARYDQIASGNGSFSGSGDSFGSMFEMMRSVPEGSRDQIRSEMGRLFEARERAEINSFFAMSPDQRMNELDRRIRDEDAQREARRAEWAQRQSSGDAQGGSRGPRGGGDAGGRGGPPGGGGPGRGRGRSSTEEQRNDWRKQRLDNGSPQGRAQRDEYRRLMRERREQLGLSGGRRWWRPPEAGLADSEQRLLALLAARLLHRLGEFFERHCAVAVGIDSLEPLLCLGEGRLFHASRKLVKCQLAITVDIATAEHLRRIPGLLLLLIGSGERHGGQASQTEHERTARNTSDQSHRIVPQDKLR